MLVVELGVSAANVRNYLGMYGVTHEAFCDGVVDVEPRGATGCAVFISDAAPESVGRAVSELAAEEGDL